MYFLSAHPFPFAIATIFLLAVFSLLFLRKRSKTDVPEKSKNYTMRKNLSSLRFLSLITVTAILALLVLEPTWLWKTSSNGEGIDCIWLLDVSASMDVVDMEDDGVLLSRLEKAKRIIARNIIAHPENRYGLVIFSGVSRLVSPLTSEHDSLVNFLSGIDSKTISTGGTEFIEALDMGIHRFDKKDSSSHVMVLLSDGGDKDDQIDQSKIRDIFSDRSTSLITVGVGREKPSPIPWGRDMLGNITYKQYNGEVVLSGLNTENLKILSDIGRGNFLLAKDDLDDALSNIAKHSTNPPWSDSTVRILALVSLLFLMLFLLVPSSFSRRWNAS